MYWKLKSFILITTLLTIGLGVAAGWKGSINVRTTTHAMCMVFSQLGNNPKTVTRDGCTMTVETNGTYAWGPPCSANVKVLSTNGNCEGVDPSINIWEW